jgi:hypothetical protein
MEEIMDIRHKNEDLIAQITASATWFIPEAVKNKQRNQS